MNSGTNIFLKLFNFKTGKVFGKKKKHNKTQRCVFSSIYGLENNYKPLKECNLAIKHV